MWIVEGAVLEGEGVLLECQDAGDWARNWGVVLARELTLVAAIAAADWPDLGAGSGSSGLHQQQVCLLVPGNGSWLQGGGVWRGTPGDGVPHQL